MREIKFRAWIAKDRVMFFDGSLPEVFFPWLVSWKESKGPFVVMQYTGLKDKNGAEIYEGDIIYLAGYGEYEAVFPFMDLYEAGAEGDIGGILGNIYENPELITGKTL